MKWSALIVGAVSAVLVAIPVHCLFLLRTPIWATDKQIAAAFAKGAKWNELKHNPPPLAGTTSVPLANPDSLSSRAFLDLNKGPLLLKGPVPTLCTYWSASVFEHNTDTSLVISDRDIEDGDVEIIITNKPFPENLNVRADAIATLKSDKAVVLLRCFMRDPTDRLYMKQLDEQRRKIKLIGPNQKAIQ